MQNGHISQTPTYQASQLHAAPSPMLAEHHHNTSRTPPPPSFGRRAHGGGSDASGVAAQRQQQQDPNYLERLRQLGLYAGTGAHGRLRPYLVQSGLLNNGETDAGVFSAPAVRLAPLSPRGASPRDQVPTSTKVPAGTPAAAVPAGEARPRLRAGSLTSPRMLAAASGSTTSMNHQQQQAVERMIYGTTLGGAGVGVGLGSNSSKTPPPRLPTAGAGGSSGLHSPALHSLISPRRGGLSSGRGAHHGESACSASLLLPVATDTQQLHLLSQDVLLPPDPACVPTNFLKYRRHNALSGAANPNLRSEDPVRVAVRVLSPPAAIATMGIDAVSGREISTSFPQQQQQQQHPQHPEDPHDPAAAALPAAPVLSLRAISTRNGDRDRTMMVPAATAGTPGPSPAAGRAGGPRRASFGVRGRSALSAASSAVTAGLLLEGPVQGAVTPTGATAGRSVVSVLMDDPVLETATNATAAVGGRRSSSVGASARPTSTTGPHVVDALNWAHLGRGAHRHGIALPLGAQQQPGCVPRGLPFANTNTNDARGRGAAQQSSVVGAALLVDRNGTTTAAVEQRRAAGGSVAGFAPIHGGLTAGGQRPQVGATTSINRAALETELLEAHAAYESERATAAASAAEHAKLQRQTHQQQVEGRGLRRRATSDSIVGAPQQHQQQQQRQAAGGGVKAPSMLSTSALMEAAAVGTASTGDQLASTQASNRRGSSANSRTRTPAPLAQVNVGFHNGADVGGTRHFQSGGSAVGPSWPSAVPTRTSSPGRASQMLPMGVVGVPVGGHSSPTGSISPPTRNLSPSRLHHHGMAARSQSETDSPQRPQSQQPPRPSSAAGQFGGAAASVPPVTFIEPSSRLGAQASLSVAAILEMRGSAVNPAATPGSTPPPRIGSMGGAASAAIAGVPPSSPMTLRSARGDEGTAFGSYSVPAATATLDGPSSLEGTTTRLGGTMGSMRAEYARPWAEPSPALLRRNGSTATGNGGSGIMSPAVTTVAPAVAPVAPTAPATAPPTAVAPRPMEHPPVYPRAAPAPQGTPPVPAATAVASASTAAPVAAVPHVPEAPAAAAVIPPFLASRPASAVAVTSPPRPLSGGRASSIGDAATEAPESITSPTASSLSIAVAPSMCPAPLAAATLWAEENQTRRRRVALIVGVDEYFDRAIPAQPQCGHDARHLAATLERIGFEVSAVLTTSGGRELDEEERRYRRAAARQRRAAEKAAAGDVEAPRVAAPGRRYGGYGDTDDADDADGFGTVDPQTGMRSYNTVYPTLENIRREVAKLTEPYIASYTLCAAMAKRSGQNAAPLPPPPASPDLPLTFVFYFGASLDGAKLPASSFALNTNTGHWTVPAMLPCDYVMGDAHNRADAAATVFAGGSIVPNQWSGANVPSGATSAAAANALSGEFAGALVPADSSALVVAGPPSRGCVLSFEELTQLSGPSASKIARSWLQQSLRHVVVCDTYAITQSADKRASVGGLYTTCGGAFVVGGRELSGARLCCDYLPRVNRLGTAHLLHGLRGFALRDTSLTLNSLNHYIAERFISAGIRVDTNSGANVVGEATLAHVTELEVGRSMVAQWKVNAKRAPARLWLQLKPTRSQDPRTHKFQMELRRRIGKLLKVEAGGAGGIGPGSGFDREVREMPWRVAAVNLSQTVILTAQSREWLETAAANPGHRRMYEVHARPELRALLGAAKCSLSLQGAMVETHAKFASPITHWAALQSLTAPRVFKESVSDGSAATGSGFGAGVAGGRRADLSSTIPPPRAPVVAPAGFATVGGRKPGVNGGPSSSVLRALLANAPTARDAESDTRRGKMTEAESFRDVRDPATVQLLRGPTADAASAAKTATVVPSGVGGLTIAGHAITGVSVPVSICVETTEYWALAVERALRLGGAYDGWVVLGVTSQVLRTPAEVQAHRAAAKIHGVARGVAMRQRLGPVIACALAEARVRAAYVRQYEAFIHEQQRAAFVAARLIFERDFTANLQDLFDMEALDFVDLCRDRRRGLMRTETRVRNRLIAENFDKALMFELYGEALHRILCVEMPYAVGCSVLRQMRSLHGDDLRERRKIELEEQVAYKQLRRHMHHWATALSEAHDEGKREQRMQAARASDERDRVAQARQRALQRRLNGSPEGANASDAGLLFSGGAAGVLSDDDQLLPDDIVSQPGVNGNELSPAPASSLGVPTNGNLRTSTMSDNIATTGVAVSMAAGEVLSSLSIVSPASPNPARGPAVGVFPAAAGAGGRGTAGAPVGAPVVVGMQNPLEVPTAPVTTAVPPSRPQLGGLTADAIGNGSFFRRRSSSAVG